MAVPNFPACSESTADSMASSAAMVASTASFATLFPFGLSSTRIPLRSSGSGNRRRKPASSRRSSLFVIAPLESSMIRPSLPGELR